VYRGIGKKVGYYCADPGIWLRSRRLSVFQCL